MKKVTLLRKLALACVFLFSANSNAQLMSYDISVSGNWFDNNGTPYGMALSPSLTGSLTIDDALTGNAALIDFSLQTGTKLWTESEFTGTASFIYSTLGDLTQFSLTSFTDSTGNGSMYIYSNDTFGLTENNTTRFNNACNGCVSFTAGTAQVSEPATLALLGFGLVGLALTRKKKQA